MAPSRVAILIVVVSLASAALLAFASRAPAEIRNAEPPPDATDPDRGARFAEENIARHGRYRAAGYLSFALFSVIEIIVLVLLVRGGLAPFIRWTSSLPGGTPLRAAALAALVALVLWIAALPLAYVRGFALEHAWGLSTQDFGAWLSDGLRSLGVAVVTIAIAAAAFFALLRWFPRWWWVAGWLVFTALAALFAFLWPLVIAPLFNTFTPLEDPALERRVRALAARADVDVEEVLVADASRRSTTENAYVAGLGASKRMVLYDTLLRAGSDDETALVVAHELGHEVEGHRWKSVLLASVGLLAGFAFLAWLAGRAGFWAWGGASGPGDPRAVPLLLLVVTVAGLVTLPLQNAISRSFERRADGIALELTEDRDTFVRVMRRLAFSNLSDLRPPRPLVWALYSHPPVPERIDSALAGSPNAP